MLIVVAAFSAGRYWFNAARRIKRALHAVPITAIRDVRDGRVARIAGHVELGEAGAVVSPFSNVRCVWYQIVVEEYVSSGKSGSWKEQRRIEHGVPFWVRDETGRALVEPAGAHTAITPEAHTDASTLDPFLASIGIEVRGLIFHKRLRILEARIDAQERVTAGGRARREPDPEVGETGYREIGTRLVMEAAGALPLLITDDPNV